jgi:putative membrane protein
VSLARDDAVPARPVVTADEAAAIERRIGALEARTGIEVVAAVERRSDIYPEVPWRAFALGVALAALAVLGALVLRADGDAPRTWLVQAVAILGTGAVAALGSAFLPGFGRLFIRRDRMEEEVRQRAQVVFLARELFATPGRDAILVLVSLFERQVAVIPDVGWCDWVADQEWRAVVERMTPLLAQGRVVEAFDAGCGAIEELLAGRGRAGDRARGLLPDTLVQGEGSGE